MRHSRVFCRVLNFFQVLTVVHMWERSPRARGAPLKPERKAVIFTEMDGDVLECSITSLLTLVPALFPLPYVQGEMGYDAVSAL